MNNKKKLREEVNALYEKGQAIVKNAQLEVRDLTSDEMTSMGEYRSQIETLNKSIEDLEETREEKGQVETTGEKNNEVKDLDNTKAKQLETRSVEMFFRGQTNTEEYRQNAEELRDITGGMTAGNNAQDTAGNGGITIPDLVAKDIILKLEQESPVLALSEKIASVTGSLSIARESKASDNMAFVGEGKGAAMLEGQLKTVTLTQKRVAAGFQLTQQLINDSATPIVDYAVGRVSRSVARRISSSILIGSAGDANPDADQNFRPVIGDKEIVKHAFAGADITVPELIAMRAKLHQGYTRGAVWIVSNRIFQQMAGLQDGDGRYLIFQSIVNGDPEYTLFGSKVYVDDSLDKMNATGEEIIYGNFNAGYAVMTKKGMSLTHVTADTQQALAGGHLVVLDTYMDGAVKNPDAFIIGVAKKA